MVRVDVFGLLKWDPVPILLSKVESAGFMRYVTQFNGYIVGTNYGMHNNGLPVSDKYVKKKHLLDRDLIDIFYTKYSPMIIL
jgi:hypothetical protein